MQSLENRDCTTDIIDIADCLTDRLTRQLQDVDTMLSACFMSGWDAGEY